MQRSDVRIAMNRGMAFRADRHAENALMAVGHEGGGKNGRAQPRLDAHAFVSLARALGDRVHKGSLETYELRPVDGEMPPETPLPVMPATMRMASATLMRTFFGLQPLSGHTPPYATASIIATFFPARAKGPTTPPAGPPPTTVTSYRFMPRPFLSGYPVTIRPQPGCRDGC